MNAAVKYALADAARSDLLTYATLLMPNYKVDLMHEAIAEALAEIEAGTLKRLIIEAPPQHGKTLELAYFMSWYLGRHPSQSLIYTSYGTERVEDVGRIVRSNIRSAEHARIFGQVLCDDSASIVRFSTENLRRERGYFFAVGRGGAMTGRGGNGIVVDDPIKDRREADSVTIRRQLEEWYSSVLLTRLRALGWIILTLTRWHKDDLAGYLATRYAHDGWRILRMPALAEENDPLGRKVGEAIAPQIFTTADLLAKKEATLPRDWKAMFQQSPTETAGDLYKREWFEPRYESAPTRVRYYGISDYAASEGSGDATEHAVWAIDPDFNAFAVDWYSGHVRSDVWVERQLDMIERWKPICWYDEGGPITKTIRPYQARRMRERRCYCRLEAIPSVTDKVTRSQAAIARASHKRILFPQEVWADDVIEQLADFHEGATDDDKVDVVSLLGLVLDKMAAPSRPSAAERNLKPFTVEWLMHEEKHEQPSRY